MRLKAEGLFLVQRLEGLTAPVFQELIDRGEQFSLKVDYGGLPPPLEELDLVHLLPGRLSDLPTGTLVLRRVRHWFEFQRVAPGNHVSRTGDHDNRVARVLRVERPGALVRLDSAWWRFVGSSLVRVPGFPRAYDRVRRLRSFAGKLVNPLPCPVSLGPSGRLAQGVIEKHAHPSEVRYRTMRAAEGLEAWEEGFFARAIQRSGCLLVVGCGAGREAIALAKRGFAVVGVDPVPGLIAAARERAEAQGVTVAFEVRAPDDLPYPPEAFDCILCPSPVYAQTPVSRRRIELLRTFQRLMTPDGVLALSAGWHGDRGPRLALVDALRRLLRQTLGKRFPTEPGDRLIRHLSLASDAQVQCFYHVFRDPEEIRREILAAGLIGERDPEGPWIIRKPDYSERRDRRAPESR